MHYLGVSFCASIPFNCSSLSDRHPGIDSNFACCTIRWKDGQFLRKVLEFLDYFSRGNSCSRKPITGFKSVCAALRIILTSSVVSRPFSCNLCKITFFPMHTRQTEQTDNTGGVHSTNGNKATECILYQTRVLCHIRTLILIQCVSGLAFLFCTPQPSKRLDFKAFWWHFCFLPFVECGRKYPSVERQGGNCPALDKRVLQGCSLSKREQSKFEHCVHSTNWRIVSYQVNYRICKQGLCSYWFWYKQKKPPRAQMRRKRLKQILSRSITDLGSPRFI